VSTDGRGADQKEFSPLVNRHRRVQHSIPVSLKKNLTAAGKKESNQDISSFERPASCLNRTSIEVIRRYSLGYVHLSKRNKKLSQGREKIMRQKT